MNAILKKLSVALVLGMLAVPQACAAGHAGRRVYRDAIAAVVYLIRADGATGTGWVVDREAKLVITNFHVVGRVRTLQVYRPRFENGRLVAEKERYAAARPLTGHVLQVEERRDLAVVEVPGLPADVAALPLAEEEPGPGDVLHSIGNPSLSGALWVYTSGTVRAVYLKRWMAGNSKADMMQLEARVVESQSATNPGDSGGPVLNDDGQVVAVTEGFAREATLIRYAIAAAEVRELLAAVRPLVHPVTAAEWDARGRHLAERERYADAVSAFATALDRHHAEPALVLVRRAEALRLLGKRDAARGDLEKALSLDARSAAAHLGLAKVLEERGEDDAAEAHYDAALRLDPRQAAALPTQDRKLLRLVNRTGAAVRVHVRYTRPDALESETWFDLEAGRTQTVSDAGWVIKARKVRVRVERLGPDGPEPVGGEREIVLLPDGRTYHARRVLARTEVLE
jgi:hypothetical protein